MSGKKSDLQNELAGLGVLVVIGLLVHSGVINLHFNQNAFANGTVITFGGDNSKQQKVKVKSLPNKAPKLTMPKSCLGRHKGYGCLAAGYVSIGRIYIPASDDKYDYQVAIGERQAPSNRITPIDHVYTHYFTVNRPVWLSLVRMANSLNSKMCHKVKGKHPKHRRVCKMTLGAVEITCLEKCHPYYTSSGYKSDHTKGEAVDVGAVRWRGTWHIINYSWQHTFMGKMLLKDLTIACLRTGAHQALSLLDFGYGERSKALPDHYNHFHCGGYDWM